MKPENDKVITGIFGKDKGGKQRGPSTTKLPRWPEVSRTGEIVEASIANVRAFLNYLGVAVWLDQFSNCVRIEGAEEHQVMDDHALYWLWGQAYDLGFRPSTAFMKHAFKTIAGGNARHPLRDWLKSLIWDGVPRVERLFPGYAGAEDNPLNRAIGKLLLVAMVRRIIEPGCKFDYMPILQGPQGCKKSTFCKTLAGGSEFFEKSLTLTASVKQLMENTAGKWVVEIAELKGLTPKDIEHQKALITRTHDRSRLCRRDSAESIARPFVIIGTTNEEVFLCDSTGNRRYLPVRVSDIDIEALERDRDQLLAEACELEKTYGPLIMPAELSAELLRRQKEVTVIDPAHERVHDYISGKLWVDPHYEFPKDDLFRAMGTKHTSKAGKVLAQIACQYGLVEKKRGPKENRIRKFVREEAAETEDG
jgi:predicted P-loop ATPase